MSDTVTAARRLYDAMAARDGEAILAAMTEDFVGDVSEGMPYDVGGRHEGREAMLRDVWGKIFIAFDVEVAAERYLAAGDDVVVAIGHYRGVHRETQRVLDARFAHVLTIRDDRVAGLDQYTDTQRWTG